MPPRGNPGTPGGASGASARSPGYTPGASPYSTPGGSPSRRGADVFVPHGDEPCDVYAEIERRVFATQQQRLYEQQTFYVAAYYDDCASG